MIELILEHPPLVWKAPFVGSRGAFSPRYREKKIVQDSLRQDYKGHIIKIPIRCDFTFYMPIPKSASKKKRALMLSNEIQPTSGGDLTNLRKFAEDCLQDIVIENDRQIIEGYSIKLFAENPRTVIQIFPIIPKD